MENDLIIRKDDRKEIPHRLNDNLHWICSYCLNSVSTSDTNSHISDCLFSSLLPQTLSSSSSSLSSSALSTSSLPESLINMIKSNNNYNNNNNCDRPRTKRLERPTPNIIHPVIDCINITNKPIRRTRICTTCERSSYPERFHSHSKTYNRNQSLLFTTAIPSSATSLSTSTAVEIAGNNTNTKHDNLNKNKSFDKELNNKSLNHNNSENNIKDQKKKLLNDKKSNTEQEEVQEKSNEKSTVEILVVEEKSEKTEKDEKQRKNFNKKQCPTQQSDVNKCNKQSSESIRVKMKCYLCKNEYGPEEMEAHEIDCLEKWKHCNESNERTPSYRGSMSSITGCDTEGWEHFKSQLTPCPKCGRTFFPHRLTAHQRVCKGTNQKVNQRSNKSVNLILCVKCGKKFKSGSLALHEFKCSGVKKGE